MKKPILKALVCLVTLLLLSCEKDLYEDAIHQEHEHQGNIYVKTLSFEEFTQKMKSKNLKTGLEGFMNASQMGSSQAKSGEDNFEIVTVDIRQVTSGTYTSYTMFLKTPDPDDKNFYNITFEEKDQDIVLFITKYIATENWITNKNSAFEGEIFTKRIPGNVTEANRLIKLTEAFEGLPDAGNNNPGSGVGSGSGGGTNSGNYPQDCDGEVRTTIIVEPIMCSENVHWPWETPDPECTADVKATFETTYIYECIPDNPNPIGGGTPGSGSGSGSGGADGSSSGSTAPSLTSIISTLPLECPIPPPGDMDFDCDVDDDEANYLAFIASLSLEQKQYLKNNRSVKYEIFYFLDGATFNEEAKEFADEAIDALNTTEFENEAEKLAATKVLIYTHLNNYFNQNLDDTFFTTITSYSTLDSTDPTLLMNMARLFLVHCATLKQENPNWSDAKILVQAWKDTSHFLADLAGLVPVIGEVADLANGTLYLIEGDGVNASLSYASSIPIAGWFSAGVKFAKRADGLKYVVVGAENLINFGAANSKKFRAACGIAVGDATKQAHHIIPRGSDILNHEVVQKAAKATNNQGFHIDEALNGIAVASWRNQPNHNAYNNKILTKLNDFKNANPNATPQQCYNKLMDIINEAKTAIVNNPNVHLNDLNF